MLNRDKHNSITIFTIFGQLKKVTMWPPNQLIRCASCCVYLNSDQYAPKWVVLPWILCFLKHICLILRFYRVFLPCDQGVYLYFPWTNVLWVLIVTGTHCGCIVNRLFLTMMSWLLIKSVLSIVYLSPWCHEYSLGVSWKLSFCLHYVLGINCGCTVNRQLFPLCHGY